jgi:copper chaperone CopZ
VRVQEIVIEVSGMTSPDCEQQISDALAAVPGVHAVRVKFNEGRAVVSGDPDAAHPDALRTAIAGAGYTAGDIWFAE